MTILLVMTHCPDEDVANQIALAAVEGRLAACVNILPRVQSIYRWQGAVESTAEIPLHLKTTADAYPALAALIHDLHPYETPEIVALQVNSGWPPYLEWVRQETHR